MPSLGKNRSHSRRHSSEPSQTRGGDRKHSRHARHSRHSHSRSAADDAPPPHRESRSSLTDSSALESFPAVSSAPYEADRQRRLSRSNLSSSSPSASASATLPALHASTREDDAPSHLRRPADTVTIPQGLMPKEVPQPLRAEECRGMAPAKPRLSHSSNSLYTRWVNAYTYGTAAQGQNSLDKYGDKGKSPAMDERAQDDDDDADESASLSTPAESRRRPPAIQRRPERATPLAVPVPKVGSTVPEGDALADEDDSIEKWMDRAGYFWVTDGRSNTDHDIEEEEEEKEEEAEEDESSNSDVVEASNKTEEERNEKPSSLRPGIATPSPSSSKGRSLPASLARMLHNSSPVRSTALTTKPASLPPVVAGRESRNRLDRVWTPSPGPFESDRGGASMQGPYSILSNGSDDSDTAASASARGGAVAGGGAFSPLPPPESSSTPALGSIPRMRDGLEPDLDVSGNDSRHFVSVSYLTGASDAASSSGSSLWFSDDASEREMGAEMVESDEDESWSDAYAARLATDEASPRDPRQHEKPMQRGAMESNLLDIGQRESHQQQQQQQPGDVAYPWAVAPPRFRLDGHSADVIGAQRVLTLLVVQGSATTPQKMSVGMQVTLPTTATTPSPTSTFVSVDETVAVKEHDACIRSSLLREVAEEMRLGHSAALLLSVAAGCGVVGCTTVESTLSLLLAVMMRRQAQAQIELEKRDAATDEGALYFKVEASIALVHDGRFAKDLIVNPEEGLGSPAPVQPIANPLLGSWCDNTMFQGIRGEGQIKSLLEPVQTWLSKSPEEAEKAKEVICVYVVLRQVANTAQPRNPRTLTLSSLLIYISRAQDGAVGTLRNRAAATILQRSLLRRAGDGCFTVAASCVQEGTMETSGSATLCADARTVKNNGFVSGDAKRYLDRVRGAMTREAAEQAAHPGDEPEKQRAERRLNLRNDLLRSMSCLLSDPADSTVPFYLDRIAAREEAAEKAARTDGGGGMLVQSILSKAFNIHIPSVLEALEMFSDGQVRTVAIRSAMKTCGYELIDGTDSGLVRVADRVTFHVDELRPRRILPPLHTLPIATHTSALCTLFTSGYNAALASFDGRSANVFSSPVWYVLAEAIDRALNRPDVTRREVRIALSVVRGSGEALDLMDPDSTVVPLQVSSSPLFGTAVHTSKLRPVTSQNMLRELLNTVAPKAASLWQPNAFLHVLLVNFFGTEDDVFVSSFNLSVFGSHATLCQRILSNDKRASDSDSMILHPDVIRLHHGFLAGSAASVFLISLNKQEDSDAAVTIAHRDVPQLVKAPIRSGSVKEFIRRTRSALERRRLRAESAPAEERAYLARVEHRITDMLDENAALLAPNSEAFPKAYLTEHVAAAPPPSTTTAAATRPQAESAHHNDVNNYTERIAKVDSAAKNSLISGNGSAARKPGATTTSSRHPKWVLGLELGGSAAMEVQAVGVELEWTPTRERFDTDGILFYNSTQSDVKHLFTENCEAMQRLREDACAARSCAILGLTDGGGGAPDLHVRTQPLWRSFTTLVLNSAFQGRGGDDATMWKDGSELHLRMCAVQDRTLIYDFLLDDDDSRVGAIEPPTKVALATNPLFGPVVRNTTVMRAGKTSECQCIIRSGLHALNLLAGEYPSGTVIIASAVLKNVTDDDIVFSSISAFGVRIGKDLPALRDILAMDPKGGAPPSLYQYALQGPCRLLCLTTLDSSANVHCVEALRLSQGIRYGSSLPVPTGSLRRCLQEQQDLLGRSGTSAQARANTEHVARQLVKMLNDPFAPIVIFPFDDDGVLSPHHSSNANRGTQNGANSSFAAGTGAIGSGGPRCRVTAVITAAGRSETPTLDARADTNTVHVARTSYPFSEVVLRANNSSVLRPGLVSSIVQHVQQGRNSALIVADGAGSTAGASLLSKLVSVFIHNTGDNGHGVHTTLFMAVTAVRFPVADATTGIAESTKAMAKDLFSMEMRFYPLQVAHSPFFGPCVDGAHFSALNRIGDVYLTLKDAQKACSYLKATLVVTIVLKQVTRTAAGNVQDALMSSLFSVISTAETSSGAYACDVFDTMLNQREAALAAPSPDDPRAVAWRNCLLAQAFGGSSYTYGVIGLTANPDEAEAAAMVRFGARLMRVSCHLPPRSSAVDILQRATQKLQEGSRASAADVPTAEVGVPWDWHEIKAEAEEMLNSPDTCKPRAFLCS